MTSRLLVAAALLFGGSGVALAQGAPTGDQSILLRQGGMAMVGSLAELMKAGVQSGADPKTFQEAAAAMAKWGAVYPALFPADSKTGHDTKAKPEIWSDRAGFEKAAITFVEASTKLAEADKSGDKAAFAAAFQVEGQSCGGCHRNYKNR